MYNLLKDKNLNTKNLYYCINCHRGRQDFELAGQVEAQFSVKRETSTVITGYYEVCLCLTVPDACALHRDVSRSHMQLRSSRMDRKTSRYCMETRRKHGLENVSDRVSKIRTYQLGKSGLMKLPFSEMTLSVFSD